MRFTTGAIRVEPDRHHVVLPRIGRVRTHESTRKLARRLQAATARILSATVRYTGGRWVCAFQVIVAGKTRSGHAGRSPHRVVGVDVGVKDLLVVATAGRGGGGSDRGAETVDPGAVAAAGGATVRGAPVWPLRSRHEDAAGAVETLGSGPTPGWGGFMPRWPRSAPTRSTQATTGLATRHEVVAVEQLSAKNMGRRGGRRKRGLNRALGDAALGRIRTQLDYKTSWYGTDIGDRATGFFRRLNCVPAAGRKPNSGCATASTTAATDAHRWIGI